MPDRRLESRRRERGQKLSPLLPPGFSAASSQPQVPGEATLKAPFSRGCDNAPPPLAPSALGLRGVGGEVTATLLLVSGA